MSESNITADVNSSAFSDRRITFDFSSVLIVFRHFLTWVALGGVDLRFSLILTSKANAVEGGTTSAA